MKKRIIILTAAISASLVFMAGCSKGGDNGAATSGVESSSEVESTEEQTTQETETVKEEEDTTEAAEVLKEDADGEEASEEIVKIWGTITEVSEDTITVDNQSDASVEGEIIFHIDPEKTYVIDGVTGLPVAIEEIKPGKFEAYLEATGPMTMSLPPQTTPYMVIVNIPEDSEAAQLVVAAGEVWVSDSGKVLEAEDGTQYKLAEQVEILPYLTRNIVVLEDIVEGSRCLVWLNSEDMVEKIVLFAE